MVVVTARRGVFRLWVRLPLLVRCCVRSRGSGRQEGAGGSDGDVGAASGFADRTKRSVARQPPLPLSRIDRRYLPKQRLRLTRSSGLVLLSFGRCAAGELVEGEQVFLGALKEFGDLRERVAEALKHVTESCCCRFEAWGRRRSRAVLRRRGRALIVGDGLACCGRSGRCSAAMGSRGSARSRSWGPGGGLRPLASRARRRFPTPVVLSATKRRARDRARAPIGLSRALPAPQASGSARR